MTNISKYVALQKELLELEREEEKRESIASGEGKKLSLLELNGLAICRLSIESISSDVGGRQVVRLVTRGGRQFAPPRLSTGDLVAIREQRGRESRNESPGSSSATEGVVKALDEKSIEIACDEPFGDDFDRDAILAVTKITSDVTHKRYTSSLDSLEKAAENPTHSAYSLIHILLGDSPPRFHSDIQLSAEEEKLFAGLNGRQKEAVLNALKAKDLAVIHGPPGTGKTFALTAYIMLEVYRGSRVLVVAPSNVAVDNIAERLALVDPPPEFVRAGHPARMMPKVLKHSLEHQVQMTDEAKLAEDIRTELNDLEEKDREARDKSRRKAIRMEKRQLRKELKQREKSAVRRLLSRKDVILSTITGAGARVLDIAESVSPFDVVVIDEAAQALGAACWVSLLRARKAVLAGDPYQLAGTVRSFAAESRGLKKSLLDRVFAEESLRPAIRMLTTQYRMNSVISAWSSTEFYDNKLQPDPSVADRRVMDLDSCSNKLDNEENLVHPFILIDTAGGDCEEDEQSDAEPELSSKQRTRLDSHASRSNKGEAQIVVHVVSAFVQCGIALQDIAIISPYSGQVELLRNQLWPKHGRTLEVATVDSFQGREKEVVFISLVRSNEAGEVGFLSDDRRMNVAITRAKRCVVVVCDTETTSSHPLLARMVEYVENHGHYRSAVVDFPDIVGTFSQSRRPKEAIDAEDKSRASRRRQKKAPGIKIRSTEKETGIASQANQKRNRSEKIEEVEVADSRGKLRREIEQFLRDDWTCEKLFSSDLSPLERRLVHELAEEHGIGHQSFGAESNRRIKLWKWNAWKEDHPSHEKSSNDDQLSAGPLERSASSTSHKCPVPSPKEVVRRERLEGTTERRYSSEDMHDTTPTQSVQYKDMNSVLGDLSKAREIRMKAPAQEKAMGNARATDRRKRKENKNRKGSKRNADQEEDFDAVLAEYGAKPNEAGPSTFSRSVAQIVDGKLTTSITARKDNTEARKKLAAKLSKEADKRKRKPKR